MLSRQEHYGFLSWHFSKPFLLLHCVCVPLFARFLIFQREFLLWRPGFNLHLFTHYSSSHFLYQTTTTSVLFFNDERRLLPFTPKSIKASGVLSKRTQIQTTCLNMNKLIEWCHGGKLQPAWLLRILLAETFLLKGCWHPLLGLILLHRILWVKYERPVTHSTHFNLSLFIAPIEWHPEQHAANGHRRDINPRRKEMVT